MRRIVIDCYKAGSKGAKALANALKTHHKRVLRKRRTSTTFKPRKSDYALQWGAGADATVTNKLKFFQFITDADPTVNVPDWVTDPAIAAMWVDEGKLVVGRSLLSSHSGKGIKLFGQEETHIITHCPLYVQYKEKSAEFRVHVFNNEVIDVTQKKKRKDFEGEVNTKIRNHANGWVYCREDIVEPADLREQALRVIMAAKLKFGAVDIIYNKKENKCYVLEVNTAPGIEGTTLEKYTQAILKDFKNEI